MTIEQANEILRSSEIAQDPDDDFATYLYGPDDPEDYFFEDRDARRVDRGLSGISDGRETRAV